MKEQGVLPAATVSVVPCGRIPLVDVASTHVFAMERSEAMAKFEVKMGRPGGGSGTFVVVVHASTQDQARRSAEAQNPGYKAQAVRPLPLGS